MKVNGALDALADETAAQRRERDCKAQKYVLHSEIQERWKLSDRGEPC
jgi:hypothetical protein